MKKNVLQWVVVLALILGGVSPSVKVAAVSNNGNNQQEPSIGKSVASSTTTTQEPSTSTVVSSVDSTISTVTGDQGETSTTPSTSVEVPRTTEPSVTTTSERSEEAQEESATSGAKPIYRLYHPITGEHLYTTDKNEKDILYQQHGWGYEGIAWYAPSKGKPVYRLYNAGLMNHLYTSDTNEVRVLTSRHGWTSDNNGRPVFYSGGKISIYRVYNYRLRGLHHWTTDANEYNILPRHGWTQEGVVFNGARRGQPIQTQYAADEAVAAQVKGLGGYRLSGRAKKNVVDAIKQIKAQGHQMGFMMMDVHTKRGVEYNADQRFYAASTVKGPYVASLAAKNPASIAQSALLCNKC